MKTKWKYCKCRTLVFTISLASSMIAAIASDDAKTQEVHAVLIQKVKEGDFEAARILLESGDASVKKTLAIQLSEARASKMSPQYIRTLRKSLAYLGDYDARREIISDIASNRRYDQFHAIQDAADIGGNDMVNKLAETLYDDSPGGRPIDQDGQLVEDVGLPAPRHAAAIALSRIINDPTAPRIDLEHITYDEQVVKQWRDWWRTNGGRFAVK